MPLLLLFLIFFFFNDTATTEIYPLSLHDALPICAGHQRAAGGRERARKVPAEGGARERHHIPGPADRHRQDRKSTRLNSSHDQISYAVFCLKKKKKIQ